MRSWSFSEDFPGFSIDQRCQTDQYEGRIVVLITCTIRSKIKHVHLHLALQSRK